MGSATLYPDDPLYMILDLIIYIIYVSIYIFYAFIDEGE